jgi:hypothetical protein
MRPGRKAERGPSNHRRADIYCIAFIPQAALISSCLIADSLVYPFSFFDTYPIVLCLCQMSVSIQQGSASAVEAIPQVAPSDKLELLKDPFLDN